MPASAGARDASLLLRSRPARALLDAMFGAARRFTGKRGLAACESNSRLEGPMEGNDDGLRRKTLDLDAPLSSPSQPRPPFLKHHHVPQKTHPRFLLSLSNLAQQQQQNKKTLFISRLASPRSSRPSSAATSSPAAPGSSRAARSSCSSSTCRTRPPPSTASSCTTASKR